MGQVQGQVGNPVGASASQPAGSQPTFLAGGSGELVDSALHGKWYQAAKGGGVFQASVMAAFTIPVNAATLASTFCLINPLGSNRVVELIDVDFGSVSATEVVCDVALVYQATPGGVTGLSSLTAGTIRSMQLGSGAPASTSVCTFYTAATHTGTPTPIQPIFDVTATAVGISQTHYDFDGKMLLYPGAIIDLATITAALTNAIASMRWAEWPI